MALREFREPFKYKWYNSERREEVGAYISNHQPPKYEGGGTTTVQTFLLDGTDTSDQHPKTVTLLTLANGVSVDFEYWAESVSVPLHPEESGVNIHGYIYYKDSNGVAFDNEQVVQLFSSNQDSSLNNIRLYYVPSWVQYEDDGDFYDASIFGFIATKKYWDNPNQPPLHSSQDFTTWVNNWNMRSLYHVNDKDGFNLALNTIEEEGDGTPITPVLPSEDTTIEDGGDDDSNYDPIGDGDPIPFPTLPTGGDAISTGFIRVYTPTAAQLQQIAGTLWTDSFYETIKKIQNDPMEAVISLHSLPFSMSAGSAECRIGNFNTGITVNVVAGQYYKRDLGSIYIPENWASALDYGPYTTIDIYLPYIGIRQLLVDDIIKKTISVEYNVDILSGATVASIKCGNQVLYTYNTSLIAYHPISQSSFGPLFQSVAGAMGNVVSGASSGGIGGAVGGALGSAVNVALSKHSNISRGSSIGSNAGCLGIFTPYIIIHRPKQSLAANFGHFKGYPSNITSTLSSLSGYTEVESIHLTGITCTDNERNEIEALLYNGVIL